MVIGTTPMKITPIIPISLPSTASLSGTYATGAMFSSEDSKVLPVQRMSELTPYIATEYCFNSSSLSSD